ncbi:MAG: ribulose-phosphate 3-epimerase, partial [Candidatus Omnitrophota bacterium]
LKRKDFEDVGFIVDEYNKEGRLERLYDPFYALIMKSQAVGTVGKEHLVVMQEEYKTFSNKFFAIEDSIWTLYWMLDEQVRQDGGILEKDKIWAAKKQAEADLVNKIFELSDIQLREGYPIAVEARRIADFKNNVLVIKIPGDGRKLTGIYYATGELEEGGLALNMIFCGKAHEKDPLCQEWARQFKHLVNDPKLEGKLVYLIWNTEIAPHVIKGVTCAIQTSITPLEAAGMADKKYMLAYAIMISSYTGAPVQQILNVLYHGSKGNGYLFEPYSPEELQKALEDLSARYYAHKFFLEGKPAQEIEQYPNKIWVEKVIKYMQEDPQGILQIMQNASRMVPVFDNRLAALKFAIVYMNILGIKFDYANLKENERMLLEKFEQGLCGKVCSLTKKASSSLSAMPRSPPALNSPATNILWQIPAPLKEKSQTEKNNNFSNLLNPSSPLLTRSGKVKNPHKIGINKAIKISSPERELVSQIGKAKVWPSILDIPIEEAKKYAYEISRYADGVHIDVIHPSFVENGTYTDSLDKIAAINGTLCQYEGPINWPALHTHIMSRDLSDEALMPYVIKTDSVTFHIEATEDALSVIKRIRSLAAKIGKDIGVGLAVSPETDIDKIYSFLEYIDLVIVMTVQPGRGGQEFIRGALLKIKELRKEIILRGLRVDIAVDGGINWHYAKASVDFGANIVIAGGAVFSQIVKDGFGVKVKHALGAMRNAVNSRMYTLTFTQSREIVSFVLEQCEHYLSEHKYGVLLREYNGILLRYRGYQKDILQTRRPPLPKYYHGEMSVSYTEQGTVIEDYQIKTLNHNLCRIFLSKGICPTESLDAGNMQVVTFRDKIF